MSENEMVTYDLDLDMINITMTTLNRLFKLGNDATLLYLFLVKTAKIQNNNCVYATNTFISNKKGLGWNRHKVSEVRALLEEEGFLTKEVRKDEETGKIVGHYTKVHYIVHKSDEPTTICSTRSENHTVDEPHGGSSDTNTIDKKINTKDEKLSLLPSGNKVASDHASCLDPEIYNEGVLLNIFWKHTIGKGSHKSLQSKFLISGKYGGSERKSLPVWAPITSAIRNVGLDALKQGIRYFKETKDTEDEYMLGSAWTLADFCHNKNYSTYLGGIPKKKFASKDPWDAIRAEFQPLTSVCSQVFEEKTRRYYGFQLDKINSDIRWEDTISWLTARNDQWTFDAFMELEWMIAGMLWRRKKEGHNLEICQDYMIKWEELKDGFKKKARKWLKEDWELYG